jgi:hypothetical protein
MSHSSSFESITTGYGTPSRATARRMFASSREIAKPPVWMPITLRPRSA